MKSITDIWNRWYKVYEYMKKEPMINSKLIEIALAEYGVKEIPGLINNQRIMQYAQDLGWEWVEDDETPWCSILVNWVAWKAGYEYTNSAAARSWLKNGEKIQTPKMGDVVILKRGNSAWQGHVGFYIRQEGNFVYVLGGNQSNQVRISAYSSNKLLGYRRLKQIA